MNPGTEQQRDRYPDALRAGALLVVVLGHWVATLPRLESGRVLATDHLLDLWTAAGILTWFVQVVPLFVFVSAAVSTDGIARRLAAGESQLQWWAGRALAMARPTVTYLAALAILAIISLQTGGRLLGPFNQSLTIHLWFLIMLLAVQALLPMSVEADRRYGLKAVFALLALAFLIDWMRAGLPGPLQLASLGDRVTDSAGGTGWLNALVVWLLPQQLGIAWKRGRFSGARIGLALIGLGLIWLGATVASGYPVAMVGFDLDGQSNLIPPTLALIGVMWLQVGTVLLAEAPLRKALAGKRAGRVIALLGAVGMPLYLWHKLAELPAAWLGERIGAPIDAGVPGEPGFWSGRLWWIGLCLLMVLPVLAAVIAIETRRRAKVPHTQVPTAIVAGGLSLLGGLVASLALGALPGAFVGLIGVAAASLLLRERTRVH